MRPAIINVMAEKSYQQMHFVDMVSCFCFFSNAENVLRLILACLVSSVASILYRAR